MFTTLKRLVPKNLATATKYTARRFRHYGQARYCPVCNSHVSAFKTVGIERRSDAKCPVCGCMERHRLVWEFLSQHTDLFDGKPKRMLHVAPERFFARKFRRLPGLDYLSGDLLTRNPTVQMDITDIQYPDNSFDVILCSHVLEHVPDDRKAMREMVRVLKPGGWAVIIVPITVETTFEDPSVTDPKEREQLFGQHDHVRRYGQDAEQRIAEAGFQVKRVGALDVTNAENAKRIGIKVGEDLFYCTKQ